MNAAVGPLVAGLPAAWVTGVVVLGLVVLTGSWAGSLVTVAHEGGHMVFAVLTGRNHSGFTLGDGGGGKTDDVDLRRGPGGFLTIFAGYTTPPLLGLGGAALVVGGASSAVLWAALVLLAAAAYQARNGLATAVAVLALAGVGWTAWAGDSDLQALVALGIVWLLLLGGVRATLLLSRADATDPYWLARFTLVPRVVWHAVFVAIAAACLWYGGGALLGLL